MSSTEKLASEKQEELFDVIGSYGPWQRRIFLVMFAISIVGAWQNFSITFMAPNMEYWCVTPYNSSSNKLNSSVQVWNQSIFGVDESILQSAHDQCKVTVEDEENGSSTVSCSEWDYERGYYQETIVSEWDLVCNNEWLISFSKSIYMIGFLISVVVFGQMSDCVGRYPTIMLCYVIATTASFLSVFSQSYLMFIILRFFLALGRTGLTTPGYVLMMETVGPQKRTDLGIAIQFGFSIGAVTLPGLAYLVPHWSYLQLLMAIPFIPVVCVWWLIPESPRWLMTQGKTEKLRAVVAKARRINGLGNEDVPLPMTCTSDAEGRTKTVIDLMRTPNLRKRTFLAATLWAVNGYVYYNLSYNTNDLGGNPYLNFLFSGLVEFPAYIAVLFCVRRFGCKLCLITGMLAGGASAAAIMAVPQSMFWLIVTFAMIGKLFISATFGILYLYTTELFPTVVRNIALGSCSMCARIGSIIAPFARELGKSTHYTVPHGLNAALCISTGFLAFLLPNTKGIKIPDTLEEGENFYNSSAKVKTLDNHEPRDKTQASDTTAL